MRNKVVAGLIILTGILFTVSVFNKNYQTDEYLTKLAIITGLSAVFTRLLIKEKTNG